jgi:signal transduction histidine kinase
MTALSRKQPSHGAPLSTEDLHFNVSAGLKRVLGRELITNDEVAIFEMVKNSFDAGATTVHLYIDDKRIVVADDGSGMSLEDIMTKWLFVAYSSKRDGHLTRDFRDRAAARGHFAGSKGVGRFSSDRLGDRLKLQTRSKAHRSPIHVLETDWASFEGDDKRRFDSIPVFRSTVTAFELPNELASFGNKLTHGTVIEISGLRHQWRRAELQSLKAALAKLINPFGNSADGFSIHICAPGEIAEDTRQRRRAKASGGEPSARDVINGLVGNFIFADLRERTTFIEARIEGSHIYSTIVDRGEIIYKIREPNTYTLLATAGFRCELYYLNHSAKTTFARRVGLPSVQFGSVFLFRNGFRVYPIGEDGQDWFGFDRRKQQGFARFLGSREIIGRVDVAGAESDFQEASSRNQGLIETAAVRELQRCVMEHCLKRLEKYVVPVSWVDKADADSDDISRLLTDSGRARVAAAVAKLVDNDDIELLSYSKRLVQILNERSGEFEASLASFRLIAHKAGDAKLIAQIDLAERRFEDLRRSEAEARKIADRERAASLKATERALRAESDADLARSERDIERRRARFLDALVDVDVSRIVNLHHQVTIYSVDLNQQIENLLVETQGRKSIPRDEIVKALEQMSFLNRRIQAATKFATVAKFQLDSGEIEVDLPSFIEEYIVTVPALSGVKRTVIEVQNDHPGFVVRFNPMDVGIIVENLISNGKRANAKCIRFGITGRDDKAILLTVSDDGHGLARGADPERIFEMGYTTTGGSGLGLYHVRQVLSGMNGSIEFDRSHTGPGAQFKIAIASRSKRK